MTQGKPIAYLMRHGDTELNDDNKFRGWLNPPLNKEGIGQANDAAQMLKDKGISRVVCSDLVRAHTTAMIIGANAGVLPEPDCDLRPWNLGDLAGRDKDDYDEVLQELLADPDARPPGDGESLNEFHQRNLAAVMPYLRAAEEKDGPLLIVVHTSNIISLADDESAKPEDADIVGPGGIVEVYGSDGAYQMKPIACCGEKAEAKQG